LSKSSPGHFEFQTSFVSLFLLLLLASNQHWRLGRQAGRQAGRQKKKEELRYISGRSLDCKGYRNRLIWEA
jgi:hypothetical protein